jgi:hypothetical protein
MPTYRVIPTKQLMTDTRYQRELDERHVARIVNNFDPNKLGTLHVSDRGKAKYPVFDGQHRLAALRKLGIEKAPCLVYSGLSAEQEAELFSRQGDRRKVHTIDLFRAAVFAGEPEATAIMEIVQRRGYTIENVSNKGRNIYAVQALRWIYRRGGGEALDQTLGLIECWNGDPKATDSILLRGVCVLLERYGDRIGPEHRVRLAEVGPMTVLRRAKDRTNTVTNNNFYTAAARELSRVVGVRGAPRKRRPWAAPKSEIEALVAA